MQNEYILKICFSTHRMYFRINYCYSVLYHINIMMKGWVNLYTLVFKDKPHSSSTIIRLITRAEQHTLENALHTCDDLEGSSAMFGLLFTPASPSEDIL